MVQFEKCSALEQNILASREAYLDSLPVSQELFVEMQVRQGTAYVIKLDQKQRGHLIIGPDNVLVEFYLEPLALVACESIFGEVLKTFEIKKVFCKSFDSMLLKNCLLYHNKVTVEGTLFRERLLPVEQKSDKIVAGRDITENDIPELIANREGLFDTDEEAIAFAQKKHVLVFEEGRQLIGWGLYQRINQNRPFFDVGMLVHQSKRKMGYGTAIISYMADYCMQMDGIPVCGCAKANIGSRKTLERAGYRSRYDLLAFHV